MKVVRQVRLHNDDLIRFRVWRKTKFVAGWHAEIKVGSRQWNVYPGRRARERQMAELGRQTKDG